MVIFDFGKRCVIEQLSAGPHKVYGAGFPGETFRVLKEKEIKQFGEFRTRRLILEAWDKLESVWVSRVPVSSEPSVVIHEQPVAVKPMVVEEPSPAPAKSAPKKELKAVEENPAQPMLSDFGLYKCGSCGKLVMGYGREDHEKDTHRGREVEWRRIR